MCDGRSDSPITGAKMTATNHEATSATAITANSEKQYWPVLLSAKPIGRKPRTVTSVPVSMGKAVEVKAKVAALIFSMPSSIFEIIISMVIIASSTRSPSAMMRAPSEMRCRLMPSASMATKTMASTSGMDRATTSPALKPEAEEADRQHDDDRLDKRLGEPADGLAHDLGLVRHEVELDADGKALLQAFGRLVQALAEGRDCCRRRAC